MTPLMGNVPGQSSAKVGIYGHSRTRSKRRQQELNRVHSKSRAVKQESEEE